MLTDADHSAPVQDALPHEARAWLGIPVAYMLRGNISRPLHQMCTLELRQMAGQIGLNASFLPHLLDHWGLPQLEGAGFWVGTVLPAIRKELERRSKPKRYWGTDSPIARLKTLDIVQVASRFTQLRGNGDLLKGLCPLHQERTPSFYIYVDSRRWRCYGACADGGDVVDLLSRLAAEGALDG